MIKKKFDFDFRRELEFDLAFLKKIVEISSPSKNPDGVMKVQNCLASELESLGFEVSWVLPKNREGAELLHATKKGASEKNICFVGHADTVLGPNSSFNYLMDEESQRILGPGVADDKGGLVVALRGVREFLSEHPGHIYNLHFISSPNEEVGSLGFHDFYKSMGEVSDFVFGFEPALFDGSIVNSRNGNAWYRLNVKGKSAHAGRFGEVTINAAHEISRIIYHLHGLNDLKEKTKVNVGTLTGGTGHFNVTCGEAEALIDMRFATPEARQRLHEKFCEIISSSRIGCLETGSIGSFSFEIEDDCPPMALTKIGSDLALDFVACITDLEGREPPAKHTGGAADVNYFSTGMNAVVDGLGPIGGGLHTVHEYVELPSIYTRSEALKRVLEKLNSP